MLQCHPKAFPPISTLCVIIISLVLAELWITFYSLYISLTCLLIYSSTSHDKGKNVKYALNSFCNIISSQPHIKSTILLQLHLLHLLHLERISDSCCTGATVLQSTPFPFRTCRTSSSSALLLSPDSVSSINNHSIIITNNKQTRRETHKQLYLCTHRHDRQGNAFYGDSGSVHSFDLSPQHFTRVRESLSIISIGR